ncbi:hypothetical protein M1O53_04180 [Dehalococcoidia bacterium]|nr:hypothetical protein [Dehalococcoidia bacterium]
MKTKHRILSVLTVLALVATLCAVMVSPAGATGIAVVNVVPHTAGETGAYTIEYIAPAALGVGDTIAVTFPAGTTVPPTADWLPGDVTITVGDVTENIVDVAVLVRTAVITTPVSVTKGDVVALVFTRAAGIGNPAPGSYTLTVAGITSQPYTIGGITIDPKEGLVGTEVAVSGVGFDPPETVDVYFEVLDAAGNVTGRKLVMDNAAVGAGGAFTGTFDVPATVPAVPNNEIVSVPPGDHRVRTEATVVDHSVTFEVTIVDPVITLDPATAVPGTTITVSGEHFPAGERVLVRWDGPEGMLIGFATTDGAGTFATSVIIPLAAPGDYRIDVHVEDPPPAGADHAAFTIPAPVVTLTPAEGPVRQTVTVTGEHFPALSTIVIRWRGRTPGNIMLPPEALTNALGAFSTQVTVPVDLSGDRRIYAYVRDFQGPDDLPLIFDWASYTIEPGVPRIGVRDGFHAIWEVLDHSVWVFREGEWYQHHTDPVMHALIDPDNRFEYLEAGLAYWFYLTEPIENVLVGGVTWTLSAGWHNRGWTP